MICTKLLFRSGCKGNHSAHMFTKNQNTHSMNVYIYAAYVFFLCLVSGIFAEESANASLAQDTISSHPGKKEIKKFFVEFV